MDMGVILPVVGIIVLLGVAAACVFVALKLRQALVAMDTKVAPALDNALATTGKLREAAVHAGPLMQDVNVMLDSIDVEVVKIDEKVADLQGKLHMVSGAVEAVPEVASKAKSTVKKALPWNK